MGRPQAAMEQPDLPGQHKHRQQQEYHDQPQTQIGN
jgi:hypothetical protein